MFNFFEQPWTLTAVAIVTLLVILIARPPRKLWYLWLLPFLIGGIAFGLDYLVQTDPEMIRDVIKTAVKAAENENCSAIEPLISEHYRDSLHKRKSILLVHCNGQLSGPTILKTIRRVGKIDLQSTTATVRFSVRVLFDPKSYVYEMKQQMLFSLEADFEKQNDRWLFTRIEIRKIDLMDANWTVIR